MNDVRVLYVSTNQNEGGAALAASRLHRGMRHRGVDSRLFVLNRDQFGDGVFSPTSTWHMRWFRMAQRFEQGLVRRHMGQRTAWSINRFPTPAAHYINGVYADVIHLHWVYNSMLPIQALPQLNAPIVWSLHDMWALTGGCHYSNGCDRFMQACGYCPQLGNSKENDLSRRTFDHKRQHWQRLAAHIIASSHWMARNLNRSPLFADMPVHVIPNGLDLTHFRRYEEKTARTFFKLPQDKQLILFGAASGASDPRKGFVYLSQMLEGLALHDLSNVELVVFGYVEPEQLKRYPLPAHHVPFIRDERLLPLLYSAVDVIVVPSKEDNLPNIVAEGLACGTPCVAFNIGGMPDMITHKTNGYLARPFDVDDLLHGIIWVLDDAHWQMLSTKARQWAETTIDMDIIVNRLMALYAEISDR